MTVGLISEAEALEHCHIARDGNVLSFGSDSDCAFIVWMTAKSVGLPTPLSQNRMPNNCHAKSGKGQLDREESPQVGRVQSIDFSAIKGYACQKLSGDRQHRTVVIRRYLEKAFACADSDRNRLILMFARNAGFRSGEISSFRAEWCDSNAGDLFVLDSKKLQLFPAYPDAELIHSIEEYRNEHGIERGILITGRKHTRKVGSKSRGEGMTEQSLTRICYECCDRAHVPRVPLRYYRALFALNLIMKNSEVWDGNPLSMMTIVEGMFWMRHTRPEVFMDYLWTIYDYDLLKNRALKREMKAVCQGVCRHADSCRGFQPQEEVEAQTP